LTPRIMVINHTQAVLEMFDDLLSNEGYQVFLATFGAGDMQAVEHVMPDLLILDYVAGRDRSGWQLLQTLHNTSTTSLIPVIICTTAIRLSNEIEHYLSNMGISVVPKPFDVNDLLATIDKALRDRPNIQNA
jgi:DNA-binding response OmpR family regulator